MENQEEKNKENKKEGVIPENELAGSDSDKAYDENGDFVTKDGDSGEKAPEDQKGADADTTASSAV